MHEKQKKKKSKRRHSLVPSDPIERPDIINYLGSKQSQVIVDKVHEDRDKI